MPFPLIFPNVPIQSSRFGLNVHMSVFPSAFSRKVSVQSHAAGVTDRWEGLYTTPHLSERDHRALTAWIVSLKGMEGTFLAFDPDRLQPQTFQALASVFAGSTLVRADSDQTTADDGNFPSGGRVAGAGQTGNSLSTNGWPKNSTVLKAGDLVQVESQLFMLTADGVSNSSGQATLRLEPAIRTSPRDSAPVIYLNPVMRARLTIPNPAWTTGHSRTGPVTLAFEEAL